MSAIPISLQIGVETTSIASALVRIAARVGEMLAPDPVRNSGSDTRTEEQLVAILGRNRLDPAFSGPFRERTTPSAQEAISRFLKGLFLASGAGPTLTQALWSGNSGLLSAVAQVSFLAWIHDAQSLAQAFIQAITDELVEARVAPEMGFDYTHLLGTIRACQQQTAAFDWEPHYLNVERRINAELQRVDAARQNMSSTNSRPNKRRKTSGTPRSGQSRPQPLTGSVSDRSVPYVVLRALIRSLESLQRFPEERELEISCGQGVSSIVVWCHYVLGISVLVVEDDTAIPFGDKPHRVKLRRCHANTYGVKAVLFEPTAERVPIFSLASSDLDPYLQSDHRVNARGFLKTILGSHGITDGRMLRDLARWLLCGCLAHLRYTLSDPNHRAGNSSISWTSKVTQVVSMERIPQSETRLAVAFLFGIEPEELLDTSHAIDVALQRRAAQAVSWPSALALVHAFARVQNRENCDTLHLSLKQFERIGPAEHGLSYDRGFRGHVPDPVVCFRLLCRMLLGARYTDEYVSRAFLVSDCGWSVFLSSLEADDPEDLDCGIIHIKLGVPARDGVRKARLIDGMTDFGIDSTETVFFTKTPEEIAFWPGVWSATLVGTAIGHDDDAFAVIQTYDWAHDAHGCRKWRLGFGEKQALCMDFWVLEKCSCGIEPSEETVRKSIEELRANGFTLRFPKRGSLAPNSPELVLQNGNVWLFFFGGDGAARWLGADGFRYLAGHETRTFAWYIRGRRCCVRCAVSFAKFPALILL